MNLQPKRIDFSLEPLKIEELSHNPIEQFTRWWQQAVAHVGEGSDAACLSSVDAKGHANARIVLLKDFNERGFVFFTNYESTKGQELKENPFAALTFYWQALGRQVRIRGPVEKTSREESESYFSSRPRGAQIGAWASKQSASLKSREDLLTLSKNLSERFKDKAIDCPAYWGGYRLDPQEIEFWQGAADRLHDRFLYKKSADYFAITRLQP
jgi:pyridoxamine 5'-phosphate oxidase